jgi:hypothetical protein
MTSHFRCKGLSHPNQARAGRLHAMGQLDSTAVPRPASTSCSCPGRYRSGCRGSSSGATTLAKQYPGWNTSANEAPPKAPGLSLGVAYVMIYSRRRTVGTHLFIEQRRKNVKTVVGVTALLPPLPQVSPAVHAERLLGHRRGALAVAGVRAPVPPPRARGGE